ncbi:MAG TPA: phosphomannomutase/phosphoglucomutase, partial [Candidatus Avimonas sp.]|nr:phosphomannomutase/phosphoglucomutase [Candidatus Avimonas sp.]
MLKPFWKDLKSGTDIRGVAVEGVAGQPVNLTDDVVDSIAAGFAEWLIGKTGKKAEEITVSVGRDSRLSGPRIRDAVVNSLTGRGINVIDCGLASTPAMFMTTKDLNCDAAVQITASHHPFNRNGLKFFTPAGGLEGSDIS